MSRSRGKIGEDLAVLYLEQKGYRIVERNATFRGGEIDIIAQYDNYWSFVEVKYRESNTYGYPEESLTKKKIHTLLRSVQFYCFKHHIPLDQVRLEFLGIIGSPEMGYEYNHIIDIN